MTDALGQPMLALVTTGAAEPTAPHSEFAPRTSGEPPTRRRTSWLAWVAIPLVVLTLGSALDAVDQGVPEVAGGTSSRYVPPDGHRSVTVDAAGVQSVSESSRTIGIEAVLAAPGFVAATLFDALGADEVAQAQWWRSTSVSDNGQRGAELNRLTNEGIEQVASWGGPLGFVFDPPIRLLPAEVQPGDEWNSSGDALPGGVLTYTATFAALRADGPFTDLDGREIPLTGGCLGVESLIVIDNADASFSTTIDESTVWCPGRGPVWSSGTINNQPSGRFEVRPVAVPFVVADDRPPLGFTDSLTPSSRLLPGRVLPLQTSDPFFGESEASGQFGVPPTATTDGRLVTVNDQGDDVQVWNLDRMTASLSWVGHPGGTVVAIGTVGDLVVATTANRRVVAYDPQGRRVWSWGSDELVIAPPVAFRGDDGSPDVIVAARSGTVSRVDAERGVALWSQSLDADARAPVLVVGDLVVLADERERLTALDATTGAVVWRDEPGAIARLTVSASSGLIVALLESGSLMAFDVTTGAERWTTAIAGSSTDLLATRDVVMVMTEESSVALDSRLGNVLWRAPGGVAIVADDGSAVVTLVYPTAIELRVAATGVVIDSLPIDASAPSSRVFARAVGDALVVMESNGILRRWELRDQGGAR